MTDDLMNERLQAAGARWRDANAVDAHPVDDRGEAFEILPAPRKRHRWVSAASAAIVAAAVVIGGAFVIAGRDTGHRKPVVAGAESPLDGTWALTDDGAMTLVFSQDRVRIDTGCVRETRKVSVDGDHLTFGSTIGNGVACAGPTERMNQVEAALDGTVTWRIADGTLLLSKAGSDTLVYTRASGPRSNLVDTTWHLSLLFDRDGNHVAVADTATLLVNDEQRLVANDGCNTLSGDVTVTLQSIELGDVAATAIACTDDPANATAGALDALLSGTVAYSIDGDILTISKAGAGRAVYAANPTTQPVTDPPMLTRTTWTLTQTEHDTGTGNSGSASGVSATSLSVLTFDGNGGFTVKHKCYTDAGKAELGGGTAKLTDVTLKLAVPCASNAESTDGQNENSLVDDVLSGDVTWAIKDGQLTITKGGDVLTFATTPPITDPATLINKRWVITAMKHGSVPADSVPASAPVQLRFDGKGGASDNVGDGGGVTLRNGQMTFSGSWVNDLTTTGKRLSADQNRLFFTILQGAVTWSITGDTLTITKTGVGALIFTKS